MLDLNVRPEESIGNGQWDFYLGMPLYQVIHVLQTHCRVIKTVEVIYHQRQPLESDLVLNLSEDGIKLTFDSQNQRLKVIEVYDFSKVKLKYCDHYFNSPQHQPTPEQIEEAFGATRPGHFNSEYHAYIMSFRGVTFFFQVNQQFETYYVEHRNKHPSLSTLPTDAIPVLSRMCIYWGSSLEDTSAPKMPTCCYHGNLYLENADVTFDDGKANGLKMQLVSTSVNGAERVTLERAVKFDDSVQKVLSQIGSPCKVFYKPPDKMRIHSSSSRKLNETRNTDYFYNYFTLGIDILFDGETHRVKKFLLHTNFPGHFNFNIYYRCDFTINFPENEMTVNPCTLWTDVTEGLGYDAGKPVVLNRSSSTNNTNPFDATCCFGMRNMIFEVMSNNHIASVTLYNSSTVKITAA